MYELHQLTENCFYVQAPAKTGIVKVSDTEVYLIDGGSDKEAGKKLKQILDARGWRLKAIYNTHSNADHIGGNKYLQTQTGCKIYAPGLEAAFTKYPVLEPSFLYGGYPFKELTHKFLMAPASEAEELTEDKLPPNLTMLKLGGHFFDMAGFRTSDGVVFLADCLSSKEILDKYKITFIYDVAAYVNTLEAVKEMKAAFFVPAHAPVTADISALAQYNIEAVHQVADKICELLQKPKTFEKLLKDLFDFYALTLTAEQYVLVGSTVRSYLSYLRNTNRAEFIFEANEMRWRAI